jgi:hypothetical protein
LPRKLPEFTYPEGLLLRRVNNSGDISWHKNRVFISEVFRFEELGVELITPGLHRVFFRDMEIGELNSEELPSELREEWSETVNERVGLFSPIGNVRSGGPFIESAHDLHELASQQDKRAPQYEGDAKE